jgi:hypothetical protein
MVICTKTSLPFAFPLPCPAHIFLSQLTVHYVASGVGQQHVTASLQNLAIAVFPSSCAFSTRAKIVFSGIERESVTINLRF